MTTTLRAAQLAAVRPLHAAPPPPRRARAAPAAPCRAARLHSTFLPPTVSRAARVGRAVRCRASAEVAQDTVAAAEPTAAERAAALEKSLADALKREVCAAAAHAGVHTRRRAGVRCPC
jgi:hypothetical protein